MAMTTDRNGPFADEAGQTAAAPNEVRNTLLAGLVGAVVAAAGYFIYSRLEEDQREALRRQLGKFVGDKLADVRSQLKL